MTMFFCGERLSGAVRAGSRAPSSFSLTALSLALRLVVVRALVTSKAGNAGRQRTAWLVASGSCGYSTTTTTSTHDDIRRRRWYAVARPGVSPFSTRLCRSDVKSHQHQHRRGNSHGYSHDHNRGYSHGYGVSEGYPEGGSGRGGGVMTASLVTDNGGGDGGGGVGAVRGASIDGGVASGAGGVSHAGHAGAGGGANGVGGGAGGAGGVDGVAVAVGGAVGVGAGVGSGGAGVDGVGDGGVGVGGGVGGGDVTGAVTQKHGGGNGKAGGKAGGTRHGTAGTKMLRLTKILADRAVGSRSEVDTMVRRGRIKVDGKVVKSAKTKLPVDCVIELNGQECGPVPLLVAYHKPRGVITTLKDDWDRKDLSTVLPKSLLLKHHPVGRLDGDSSGLLLFSSDGALTHRLLSPRFSVEREYFAKVEVPESGAEPGRELVAALKEGVTTADGVYKADVPGIDGRTVRVVVREGKNRMVRRMLANAGYPVLELRRERYGKIVLGDLPEGEHAPVTGEALEWAQSVLAGAGAAAEAGDGSDKEGDGSAL